MVKKNHMGGGGGGGGERGDNTMVRGGGERGHNTMVRLTQTSFNPTSRAH